MTGIKKVAVSIETTSGEAHVLMIENPGLSGDNPAFMSQQYEVALEDLTRRGHALIEAVYGRQVRLDK